MKQILSVDFSPNGYHIVTGSDDRTVKAWDLKNGECLYHVPQSPGVDFVRQNEEDDVRRRLFASSGYDGFVNVYSGRDFALNKRIDNNAGTLTASKITSLDLCGAGY